MKPLKTIKKALKGATAMISHNPCHMTIVANVNSNDGKKPLNNR